jgi:hypothetical protein
VPVGSRSDAVVVADAVSDAESVADADAVSVAMATPMSVVLAVSESVTEADAVSVAEAEGTEADAEGGTEADLVLPGLRDFPNLLNSGVSKVFLYREAETEKKELMESPFIGNL